MKNAAGDKYCDSYLKSELEKAGIDVVESKTPQRGEVPATISGKLKGWEFTRAWYYWIASGEKIPESLAIALNDKFGKEVRIYGYAGGLPSSRAIGGVDGYHIDTQDGLNALANIIRVAF